MFATPESVDHLMQLLIHHISHATSSQLGRMRETERALATRRRQIEQVITPTVIVPRPGPDERHPRHMVSLLSLPEHVRDGWLGFRDRRGEPARW